MKHHFLISWPGPVCLIAGFLANSFLLSCELRAEGGIGEAREEVAVDKGVMAAKLAERRQRVDQLRTKLDTAKTPEEKRAVIDEWREQNKIERVESLERHSSETARPPEEILADLKSKAGNDPELNARVNKMEQRLVENQKIKASLEAIKNADGETRQKLIEDFRRDQEARRAQRESELNQLRIEGAEARQQDTSNLPTEVQARLAKHEERKQQIEQLKEVLSTGTTEQKQKALDDFRAANELRRKEIETQRASIEQ